MRLRDRKSDAEKSKSANSSFFQPIVQAKLKVGEPNDKYEKEADSMADQVVNKSNSEVVQKKEGEEEVQQKPLADSVNPFVQKMESGDEEQVQAMPDEEPVQKMEDEESVQKMEDEESVQKMEDEEPVQAKGDSKSTNTNSGLEGKLANSKGRGSALSGTEKKEMESGFGTDFSHVNIHTDDQAAQLSQDLGARAFTHGNDVYFNKGEYNPTSNDGKKLLAHELTHTIQQKGKGSNKGLNNAVQAKTQKKNNTVPFNVEFSNQSKIAFYSTTNEPNITVTLFIEDTTARGAPGCPHLNVTIDNVSRTKKTVDIDPTKRVVKKVLKYKMKNAVKHYLYLSMPKTCGPLGGQKSWFKVTGSIKVH
ncbi:MAG: DUF4157 domain-containing protein [Flavobacteriales bacterium]|nr:DUF4157 domain-containing protein [Flavobacteriales bacterium]